MFPTHSPLASDSRAGGFRSLRLCRRPPSDGFVEIGCNEHHDASSWQSRSRGAKSGHPLLARCTGARVVMEVSDHISCDRILPNSLVQLIVHQPPLFLLLGGLSRGRFQGWNRSQWWVVHRGGLRVDGAVPRVAVHNGPVGSCSSTVAGATQFGAPYAGF